MKISITSITKFILLGGYRSMDHV